MNYKSAKSKFGALLGAVLLSLLATPSAYAAVYNVTYQLLPATNYPGSVYLDEVAWFMSGSPNTHAQWYPSPTNVWENNGTTVGLSDPGPTYFVSFSPVRNYYTPGVTSIVFTVDTNITVNYLPYTNALVVTNAGLATATGMIWTLSYPDAFTNSTAYIGGTTFTNNRTLTPIPQGSYSVTFPTMAGYTLNSANPQSTNITDASPLTNTLTGTYTRQYGTLVINITPAAASNATWTLVTFPSDYTNITTGGGPYPYTISTNMPVGNYTVQFNDLSGYTTPANASGAVSSNQTTTLSGNYSASGFRVTVHIGPVDDSQNSLEGIGAGSCLVVGGGTTNTLQYPAIVGTYYFPTNTDVTLSAIPTNVAGLDSFVYKWYDYDTSYSWQNFVTNYVISAINRNHEVWLLYSKEFYSFDSVGDIDQDGLPDVWEISAYHVDDTLYGGPAEDDGSPYGMSDNTDSDFIPSTRTNLVASVLVNSSNVTTYTFSGNGAPSYPLKSGQQGQLLQHFDTELPLNGAQLGYSKGVAFDNLLESRGLDVYYKTNGLTGLVADDDPRTDPTKFDTLAPIGITGISDGWKYYFWYWRSSDAFSAGLTNSANLSINFSRTAGGIYMDEGGVDSDSDGFYDADEYDLWTDPTHCDTDGDGMDDWWEINVITPSAGSNALDNANGVLNPDSDYYAISSNQFALTNGMAGTAFTNAVCYSGAVTNPGCVWVNIYTNTGSNVFDIFRDTIIKAATALTNRQTGVVYPSGTVFYGTSAGLSGFQQGDPVYVSTNGNINFDSGDTAVVNPPIKHDAVYLMAPAAPFPGVASYDPRTAWTHTNDVPVQVHPNTQPYSIYQEYLGSDYFGRLSWDAGGLLSVRNDPTDILPRPRTSYTAPNDLDTDDDTIEDGWELYVGMNPNDATDAALDSDDDKLFNSGEWANVNRTYANTNITIGPTDPGFLVAPAPNDPHPRDTDWDGLGDALETSANPTAYDTDGDGLPDGWEVYAGANVTNSDATLDPDGDGLLNYQEYWTGTVREWQNCDATWAGVPGLGVCFMTRKIMEWDTPGEEDKRYLISPDFLNDGSFIYYNNVSTNVDLLRTNYPATKAVAKYEENYLQYHTTLANNPDSDGDGMDDYWEVYHGLNPNKGFFDMMQPGPTTPGGLRTPSFLDDVDYVDADPNTPGFQFGIRSEDGGGIFNSLSDMASFVRATTNRSAAINSMIGPFNFGLQQMDPDGDGLPNLEEYSYSPGRTFYHTDPSPIWRTDSKDALSFINLNYGWDYMSAAGLSPVDPFGWQDWPYPYMFRYFEETEGYDTDNDGVGDYAENNSAAGELGRNPLDERDPIRNRALYVNGATDFARTPDSWMILSESFLTKFCVEAWIKPDNPEQGDQVILEKAGLYRNPYNPSVSIVGANFRLGVTNGLPYVLYNGRGSLRTYQATAQIYKLTPGVWAHIAGVYDGAVLTLYVNGEFSMALPTTELPATGVDAAFSSAETNITFYGGHGHSIMIGARDLTSGTDVPSYDGLGNSIPLTPASYFGGCIDEVRVWDGARSQAQVIANKNRRIPRSEMTTSNLVHYFSFDDVPDPVHRNSAGALDEPAAPFGLTNLDTTMSFHPPMSWWAAHPQHSTVYSGWLGAYNYLVSAANHVTHMSNSPPQDDFFHFSTNFLGTNVLSDYNNFSNPYNVPTIGGGVIIEDLYLFLGARGVATNSWLDGLDPADPDSTDTDGDGLPDWWEQLYGLDPNDAAGDNGTWGDLDHDGLNNRAEYLAGTDPLNSDTFGTGIGDYDYPRGVYSRTYGEMYTDGDGMPDYWESQNGLDPQKYDANLDLDGDGWSNYAEYQAGTDPNNPASHPNPALGGIIRYPGTLSNGVVLIVGYQTNTMDGSPVLTGRSGSGGAGINASEVVGRGDGTTKVFSGQLQHGQIVKGSVGVRRLNPQFVTPAFDFQDDGNGNWRFFPNYTDSVDGNQYVAFDYITGAYTFTWPTGAPNNWNAPWNNDSITIDYQWQDVSADTFQVSGFKEGEAYLFAFRDLNGNGTFDAGEPAGVAQNQPVNMDWKTPGTEVVIGLADILPGYGRFNWTAAINTNDYNVRINKISESGAPQVLSRAMHWSRNYVHEWDYQLDGMYGLTAGSYQWWMGSQNGTFAITWPASLAQPALVYPRGDTLYFARNDFVWTMDNNSTRYHLQVERQAADGSRVSVVNDYFTAPYREKDGKYRDSFPVYASELGNGVYYWRVAGWNPQSESAWSEWQTFTVNLSAANSRWVSGDIYYFGKAPATKIIVEAFDNRGFSGRPVARMALTPSASTNFVKSSYTLRGLEKGVYYVRAFLDVTPAFGTGANGKLDAWESFGFYRDPNNFYQAGSVNVSDVQFVSNARITIRDKDTDNDKLPDAWEMAYFGNLDQTGDMDYDGDGETNLDEYIKDGVNQNPALWDTDGDGLADGLELRYNSAAFGFAWSAKAVSATLNPNAWDTDGDGYSDGAELLRYHTDPLNPTSYPPYLSYGPARPLGTDAWSSPGDYDHDGRSDLGVYDANAGVWSLATMAGQFAALPFGFKGAQPMVGDYTGDGNSEFAFYEPGPGLWTIYTLNGQSAALKLGDASMLPAPADYTGDGRVDPAVFDTDSGIWHIYNIWSGALISLRFGASGMIPVPGDYNGDGAADLAVYEPATGNWLLGGYHKYYRTWTTFGGTLGGPTWLPVPGDYDGDGRNDICLFENNTGRWMLFTLAGQFLEGTFGWKGCVPVPGDYDGDGRTDLGVYDTNTGVWYIICWSGAYYEGRFGWPGALPITKGRF